MFFGNVLITPIRAALLTLAVALVLMVIFATGLRAGANDVQAKLDREKLANVEKARKTEKSWQEKLANAEFERTAHENELESQRSAARAADDRLRRAAGDFQRRLSQSPASACPAAASTAATLLSECSGEYQRVAAAADGHFADAVSCRAAWPEPGR